MKTRKCKNLECQEPFVNRRADAVFCSVKCGNDYRNDVNRKNELSKKEKINLQAYNHFKQLLDRGINQMKPAELDATIIDIENVESTISDESGLKIQLFDIEIQLLNGIVNFNIKNTNYETN